LKGSTMSYFLAWQTGISLSLMNNFCLVMLFVIFLSFAFVLGVERYQNLDFGVVMGLGQIFLTQVRSGQFLVARVGSAIYGLGLDLEIYLLLIMSNFSIFSLRVKKNLLGLGQKVSGLRAGQPLFYYGSKVCLGRVGSGPISTPGA